MGSRKAKSRKARKKDAPPIAAPDAADDDLRPSSTMTVEVAVVSSLEAIPASGLDDYALPDAPTARRLVERDDLAQTIEAPSAARILMLDAAEAVIAEIGFASTTDEEIVRCAGVSLDVYHAHFANKTALLHAMCDRFCAEAIRVVQDRTEKEAWESASPAQVIDTVIRAVVGVVSHRAGLVRAVLSSGDPLMLEGFCRVGATITSRVTGLFTDASRGPLPDPRDVAFALLVAVSIAHHTVLVGPAWTGLSFERDEVAERVSKLVAGSLER